MASRASSSSLPGVVVRNVVLSMISCAYFSKVDKALPRGSFDKSRRETIVLSSDDESDGDDNSQLSDDDVVEIAPPKSQPLTEKINRPLQQRPKDPAKSMFLPSKPPPHTTGHVASNHTAQRVHSNQHPILAAPIGFPVPVVAKPTWSSQPTPIGMPINRPPVNPYPAGHSGYQMPVPEPYDPSDFMSQREAEKALRELMSGAIEAEPVEISDEDTIVPGFSPDFKLLPHQVQGRNWMKSREDIPNKRYGGILADDMGWDSPTSRKCRSTY